MIYVYPSGVTAESNRPGTAGQPRTAPVNPLRAAGRHRDANLERLFSPKVFQEVRNVTAQQSNITIPAHTIPLSSIMVQA